MLAEKEVATPAPSVATDPIFIAVEMSRSKWVVGSHVPTSGKVGIHTIGWGDTTALFTLIGHLLAGFPAGHGAAVDAEFAGQRGVGGPAFLEVGAGARGGGGVELEIHRRHPPRSVGCSAGVASGRRSPRWAHRPLPRATPPDSRGSRRGRAGPSRGLPGRAALPLAADASTIR
jgi:hypothetical protein